MTSPAPNRPARPFRATATALRLLAWLPVALLGVVAATRVVGWDSHVSIVVLHALLPWLMLVAWPVAVAGVLHRQWGLAAVAIALVVLHGVWVWPLVAPGESATGPSGPVVRLATLNLYASNPRTADIAAVIRHLDADVVLYQELTPLHHRGLAAAGALDGYPHAVADPRLGSHGSAIYSRVPLGGAHVAAVAGVGMTRATLRIGSSRIDLLNVHTTSPLNGTRRWNDELRALARLASSSGLRLMAGDFNATHDHVGLRRVLAAGLDDAHRRVGRGAAVTWPVDLWRLPPLVRLDRVLVSPTIGVRGVREVTVPGSDHRAVVADLVVTG